MTANEVRELALFACAGLNVLFLHKLSWEVNAKLEQLGSRPITKKEYGLRFYNRVLKEHERLFPDSSKRTWWVVLNCLLILLIMASVLL